MNPMTSAFLRWGYLLAMGAFLAIVLQSDSREIRLYASIGLIIFAQLREISLLSEIEPVRIKKKADLPSFSSEDCSETPSPFEDARRSYAASMIERIRGGSGSIA
jgi:hypothetical protein